MAALLLACVAWYFAGRGVIGIRRKTQSVHVAKGGACDFQCGAKSVEMTWRDTVESEMQRATFDIGEKKGWKQSMVLAVKPFSRVEYKPTKEECLTKCSVLISGSGNGTRCGRDADSGSVKVGKTKLDKQGYKLCCKPTQCRYLPGKDEWVSPDKVGVLGKIVRYEPLKDFKGKVVAAASCICCDKKGNEIEWGSQVASHCKLAYSGGKTAFKRVLEGATYLDTRAAKLREWWDKAKDAVGDRPAKEMCTSYCSAYPVFKFYKRSNKDESLVGKESEVTTTTPAS